MQHTRKLSRVVSGELGASTNAANELVKVIVIEVEIMDVDVDDQDQSTWAEDFIHERPSWPQG